MLAKLKQSEFFRNVATLVSATTIAQAIPILIAPFLTRVYSPREFGIFAMYFAITTVIAVISTGRYAIAIMLPEKDSDAANLMWLSLAIAFLLSLVALLGIVLFEEQLLGIPSIRDFGATLYLIPLSIFLLGLFQTLSFWNNRLKKFRRLGAYRIMQGVGIGALQLVIGFAFYSSTGLITGWVFGQGIALILLFILVWRGDSSSTSNISGRAMLGNARRYQKFPLFSTWGALFNSAAFQVPIFVLTKYFSTATSGIFSLTFRILNLPISLISGSLSQVLFQKIVELRERNPAHLHAYIFKIAALLALATVPFIAIVFGWGEEMFGFVFGSEWREAGRIAEWMVFAVAMRFCVSPLSTVLSLDHNVKLGFMWQMAYFFTVTATLVYSTRFSLDTLIKIFVAHEIVMYGIYFYLIMVGTRREP